MARRRRRARPGSVVVGVAALVGAVLGALGAPLVGAGLSRPRPLDQAAWMLVVPGLDERLAGLSSAAGTGYVDGGLYLATRGFNRSDLLSPRSTAAVGAVELSFAPHSGSLWLNVRGTSGSTSRPLEMAPGGWRNAPSAAWQPYAAEGKQRVEFREGGVWLGDTKVGGQAAGQVELFATDAPVVLRELRFEGLDGAVLAEALPGRGEATLPERAACATGGAAAGAAVGVVLTGAAVPFLGVLGAALGLLAPLMVLATPYPSWHAFVQAAYLTSVDPASLRRGAFALAWVLLAGLSALASGVLRLRPGIPAPVGLAAWALPAAVGLRSLDGPDLLGAGLGLVLGAVGAWTARRAGQDLGAAAARDVPALLVVAWLGWALGLPVYVAWRLLLLLADAPDLTVQHARLGVNQLLVLLVALPCALELATRASLLGKAWDPAVLAAATTGATAKDPTPAPFWEEGCGDAPATLYVLGGSSAGGAYQFIDEPRAFWPSRLQERLCPGAPVYLRNFGHGGRDSFDARRIATQRFGASPPDLVLYYGGVNDLLTTSYGYTRRQREALAAELGAATKLADASRLATGLSLLVGPPQAPADPVVSVPLEDAEDNLRVLAAMSAEHGAHLLLVPEYAQPVVQGQLAAYWAMERRLADELDNVSFFDLYAALPYQEDLLADRNHLTRLGSGRAAEVLAPVVAPLLAAASSAPPGRTP